MADTPPPSSLPAEAMAEVSAGGRPTTAPPVAGAGPRRRVRKADILVWCRRLSQAFFLLLFLYLLAIMETPSGFESSAPTGDLSGDVGFFYDIDPLIAVGSALSAHTLHGTLFYAAVTLILTFLLGRFFCGWVCPFGTIHQIVGQVSPSRRGAIRVARNRTRPYQTVKYYLLLALVVGALFGSLQIGLLDPICLAVRSIGLFLLPATADLCRTGLDALAATNVGWVQGLADQGYSLVDALLPLRPVWFHYVWIIGILFFVLLFLDRLILRFWCRGLCPLGALYGLSSGFALLGMEKQHDRCTDCNLCLVHCQGAADPQGGVAWKAAECHLCFNCERACPEGVIRFTFLPRRKSIRATPPDLTRRRLVGAAAVAVAAVPLARLSDRGSSDRGPNFRSDLIRPPGALPEPEFLERCVRCGACMKACPTNALHPALLEAGAEGLWTPTVIPRIGPCEISCTICGEVCPTGAIARLEAADRRGGEGREAVRIGTAFIDRGRCLPWAMATPCIVCEEFCPTAPKAITVVDELAIGRDAVRVPVKQPHVDPKLCIGCGACEKACPVQGAPAIYVRSVGETRSRANALLLGTAMSPYSAPHRLGHR